MPQLPQDQIITVRHRTIEEILWYLETMNGFWSKQPGTIGEEAAQALGQFKLGNYQPAERLLIRWYQTIRAAAGIETASDEDLVAPLNMEEILRKSDHVRHAALLGQMVMTLEDS